MKKNNMWVICGVALVLMIATSVITGTIVGNTIKVLPSTNGTAIYTKAEVDNLLASISSRIDTINSRLNSSSIQLSNLNVTSYNTVKILNLTVIRINGTIIGNFSKPGNVTLLNKSK
jgi:hypothetical protein